MEFTNRQRGLLKDNTQAEIHGWDNLIPEVSNAIELSDIGMYLLLAIIGILVGFGILIQS